MTTIAQERKDWDLKELLPNIPDKGISALEKYITSLYPKQDQFPYHFYDHAFDVLDSAIQIINRCEEQGIKVDRTVVVLGALLHDMLYHLDPEFFNKPEIKTKEDVSAFVARNILKKIGVPEDIIEKVWVAIKGTNPEEPLDSIEAKILRAADLERLRGPYENVRNATERLFTEYKIENPNTSFKEFAFISIKYIAKYFSAIIDLTPFARDDDKMSTWHVDASRNMLSLFREVSNQDAKIVGYLGEDAFELSRIRANNPENHDLFVLFGKEDSLRDSLKFGETVLAKQEKTFTVLPWTYHSPSAPKRAFDEFLMEYKGSVDIKQYKDLIKEGGSLKIFISDTTKEYDVWGCELTESRIESLIGQRASQIIRQEDANPGVWYEFTVNHNRKTSTE